MSKAAECIVFVNYKGGTGKTTSCLSIAGFLAKSGSKVLLIDFDPQASATSGVGIDKMTVKHSVYDAVLGLCNGYEGVPLNRVIVATDVENLHLAPSEWDLSAAEFTMHHAANKIIILKTLIKSVDSLYDYVLVDTQPGTNLFMMNALYSADQVFIPFDPGVFSTEAIDNLKTTFSDLKHNTGHTFKQVTAIVTRYVQPDPLHSMIFGKNPSQQVVQLLEGIFKTIFVIPESAEIFRSQQIGIPISHHAPRSKAGKAYGKIAEAIIKNNAITA